jgi:hypothetical protein
LFHLCLLLWQAYGHLARMASGMSAEMREQCDGCLLLAGHLAKLQAASY